MKRLLLLLVMSLSMTFGGMKAMGYEQARQEAWFLTDKMAYELNLTPSQFDCAYRVNLDYLMSINTASDCYGYYWSYRDADLRCILFDWQYALYTTLDYFYRPIRWLQSAWYFPVFDRYRRGYFYFDRPSIYISYRGGMWSRRGHNDVSPYRGYAFRPGRGMRDNIPGARPIPRPEPGRPNVGMRPNRPNEGYRPSRPNDANARPGRNTENQRPSRPNGGQYVPSNRNDNTNSGGRYDRNDSQRPNRGEVGGNRGNGSYSNPGGSSMRPSREYSTSRPSRGTTDGGTTRGRSFGR